MLTWNSGISKLDVAKKFAGLIDTKDVSGLEDLLAEDCIVNGETMELSKQHFPIFNFAMLILGKR
jgi:hypothetical protein